jgi:hypothetical protein
MTRSDFQGLFRRMVKDKITVSAVAVGKDADSADGRWCSPSDTSTTVRRTDETGERRVGERASTRTRDIRTLGAWLSRTRDEDERLDATTPPEEQT